MQKTCLRIRFAAIALAVFFSHPLFAQQSSGEEGSFWLWTFLGRLHPLAVHFPVSLLLFAALLELFTLKKFNGPLRPGINISIAAGTIAAVFAALVGWLLSVTGDYAASTIDLHQWIGYATVILAFIVYFLARAGMRRTSKKTVAVYRTTLFITAVSVSVAGHLGAAITHGEDYLSSALPFSNEYDEQVQTSGVEFASLPGDTSLLSPQQQSALQTQVKSIFAHNCYKCHGAEKVKGDLRLDNKEMIFRGGESGPLFVVGNPDESELYRRITLPRGHKEAMPEKGKMLSQKQVAIIRTWIAKGAPWPDDDKEKVFRTAALEPRNPPLPSASASTGNNPVDIWVNEYFKNKKIYWPELVDDRTYLRRIYLDITGIIPTAEETKQFIEDVRPDKRVLYARQLLNRDDEYAIHWLSFWNDALRNDYTGTGYITDGRSAITEWLYASLRDNKPYDEFIKQLIDPVKESKGFIEGIRWRGVVNASQSTEIQAAQNVAQVFLGLNLKCASCHNSFINNWKLEDAYAFANVFSDSSLQINRCDKPTGKYTKARMLWEQLGEISNEAPKTVKQKELAAIMTKPDNGRLYRTIVNRIWARLMGRGIVEPVDVMDNEPWSQDLLDYMAYQFGNSGNKDLKELIYQVITSKAYQLPSISFKDANRITAEDYVFTGMVRRRMTAEQFADAVGRVVAPVFPDSLMKFDPKVANAVYLQGNSGPRASLVVNNMFLTSLGRPNRETVTTSRDGEANLLQALVLTNGSQFTAALSRGAERWLSRYNNAEVLVTNIYLEAFGRNPTPEELKIAMQGKTQLGKQEVEDLLWSLLLLPEFQLIY